MPNTYSALQQVRMEAIEEREDESSQIINLSMIKLLQRAEESMKNKRLQDSLEQHLQLNQQQIPNLH